jgi:hypothetical protein
MQCLTGGQFLGWFKFDEIYNYTKNINSAVYSFAICKKVPTNNLLPFNLKEVFYIGESGGQDPIWDQKDKKSGRGYLQTSVHNRMKQHSVSLLKEVNKDLDSDQLIVVSLFVPKYLNNQQSNKQWQKATEAELIWYYSLMFGQAPKYNLAHQSETSKKRIKENSISQKKIKEINEKKLDKFYESI